MKTRHTGRMSSPRRWFVVTALISLVCLSLALVRGAGQQPDPTNVSVLVKVRSPFAKSIEAALPLQDMELLAGQTGSPEIDAFLARHSARKMAPLYSRLVRIKKQTGQSDLEIATAIRRRFVRRSNRLRAEFRPPEISRTYLVDLGSVSSSDLARILEDFRADGNVEFAEENKVVSVNFTPNDPYFLSYGSWGQPYDDLWGIKKIGAPAAWDTSTGAGVIVAVVDTGIDYNHPDIASNIWINQGEIPGNGVDDDGNGFVDDVRGWDFIGSSYLNPAQSNNPIDHFGHGTHVAGTIAAAGNNGIGVIGAAWQAQVMAVKGLDDNGNGIDSTLSSAIIYAANNGADVISNSWAGPGNSQTIADAMSYAYNLGAVIVAAAGNNADDARNYYPANLATAITVAATDPSDSLAYFSNFGSKIDVAAPGVDVLSLRAAGTSLGTPVDSYYTRASGTSMATPHVSGTAALIIALHPDYSNEDVRQALRVSSTDLGAPGFDLRYGYGRVNAAGAVAVPSVLEAKILSPVDGASVTSAVTISGYARGNSFARYTLAYGLGPTPATWTVFASGPSPVGGGALGVFDPTVLSNGLYTIQLTSYDTSNNAFVDQIELLNDIISITSPLPSVVPSTAVVFKPGQMISVTGTAQGAGFQDFRLDWAEGINPSAGWATTGVVVAGSGSTPIINGLLGSWDTSSITKTDFYTIRLSVDNAGFTNVLSTLVYLDTQLQSAGWPQAVNQTPYGSVGVVPATDAQGNQRLATVAPSYSNSNAPAQFWSFPANGGTPNTVTLNYGEFLQPAAGSFYGTEGNQVVVADGLNLNVFQPDNSFTTLSTGLGVTFQFSQIVLEGLNNDSRLQAIALGDQFTSKTASLFAWQNDGTQLNGNFPVTIADQNLNLAESRTGPRVLVGDINGDGNKEIIVQAGPSSSTASLLLFAHDGTPLPWSAPVFDGYPNQMALADLDHNGKLETIVLVFTGSQEIVHVLQPDGTERAGWPIVLGSPYSLSGLAIGDITRTGHEQIVVSNYNNLYVLNADGTPLSNAWPILNAPNAVFGSPVLADIDGGGKPEIVLTRLDVVAFPGPLNPGTISAMPAGTAASLTPNGISAPASERTASLPLATTTANGESGSSNLYSQLRLVVYRFDGSTVSTWNLFGAGGLATANFGVVTVGDFDNSGTTDIAVTYPIAPPGGGSESGGVVTVFNTGAPYHPNANDWPMIFENPRNSAVRAPDLIPPTVAITYPAAGATVGGQITVTASASDNSGSVSVQFQLDGANLGAPVARAPFAIVWDTTQASTGSHTLTAVAGDGAGNTTVSSPVVVTVSQLAMLTLSPSSLSFAGQLLNTSSVPETITVTNASTLSAPITGVTTSSDFSQTSNCVTTLAPGASCTISVTYTPTVRGAETGNLTITGTFGGPSPVVGLSGTGQALVATLAPPSMTFPPQVVGTSSATQTFTYSNNGDLPVSISGLAVNGDFAQTNTCTSPLAVGTACSISVTFTPTTRGARTGTVVIDGNVNASAALSGAGQAASVSIAPTSLDFGTQTVGTTSAAQNVTINNNGDFSFYISGWSIASPFSVTSNNCPFPINPGTSCAFSVTFAPSGSGITTRSLSITGSFPGSPAAIALSGTGQDTAAMLTTSSLSFGSQAVNTNSSPQSTFLVNTANTPVSISSIQTTGDFSQTNNCGTTLAVSSSCLISVTFRPTATGARGGSLTINSNTRVPVAPATLSGTGTAPAPTFNLATLNYGAQRVGTSSAAQSVTLSNSGTAPLTISSFGVTGDFAQTNSCGATIAIGGSCTINVTFSPTGRGALTGSLTLNSNALGAPPSVSLSGAGIASIASVSPSSLTFANQFLGMPSAAQTVTLTNSGDATLNISSLSANGDFTQSNTCGTALPAGASCSVSVVFTPTVTGSRSATLTVADDALGGSPQTVNLAGTGVAPALTFSPSTFSSFGQQRVNTTSLAQAITLTNSGTAPLTITNFSVTANFSQTNTCGTGLAVGTSCSISVVFAPASQGNLTGTLSVNSNLPGPSLSFSLNGIGTASAVALSTSSLTFAGQLVGTASPTQSVTLTNTGGATLDISSISANGDFAQTSNCPAALAPGGNCSINATFTPSTDGTRTGSLSIADDALAGSPQTVTLAGTGFTLKASFNVASLTFSPQRVGTASAPQGVTLANTGTATVTITGFSITGDFSQTNNCGGSLAVGASCSVNVVSTPTSRGNRTGVLSLNSNASGAAPAVSLTGTGVAALASLSSTSLAFANQILNTASAPLSVTLTNTGDATLDISGISASGDFSQTNNCGSALTGGASCSVSMTFKPTATGSRTGVVTITDDASGGSSQTVSLNGTGISPSGAFSSSSLTFASQLVNTSSPAQTLTLISNGSGPLSIAGFTVTGDFSQTNNCGATLAAGATCSVNVAFTPTARGNRTGAITLNSNAIGSASVANLTGTGVAPVASLSTTSLSFSSQLVKTTSGGESVTLTNSGDVPLNISGISLNGDFAETSNCPAALAKGANCRISVTFAPAVSGNRTGVLSITDDSMNGSPQTVSLSGTGVDYSVSISVASASVTAGQSTTLSATVAAVGGNYNQAVSLTCSGLPTASSCNFSPSSVTPNSGSVNSTLKLSTTARHGPNGTPAGTYTVTITGTAHSTQHSTTMQLTVN